MAITINITINNITINYNLKYFLFNILFNNFVDGVISSQPRNHVSEAIYEGTF
mgnify:CR=1 FL=1